MQLVHVINTVFLNKPHKKWRRVWLWRHNDSCRLIETTTWKMKLHKGGSSLLWQPWCKNHTHVIGYVIKMDNFPSRWVAGLRQFSPRSSDGIVEGLDLSQHVSDTQWMSVKFYFLWMSAKFHFLTEYLPALLEWNCSGTPLNWHQRRN